MRTSRVVEVGPLTAGQSPKTNSVRRSMEGGMVMTPVLFAVSDRKNQRPHHARGMFLVVLLLAATFARAQTYPSDQVWLQSVVHASNGSATYVSEVDISNLSLEPVDVTVTYVPVNSPGALPLIFPDRIHLAPGERREMPDFLVSVLHMPSGNGMVIFDAYRTGERRGPFIVDGIMLRAPGGFNPLDNISVTSRICVGVLRSVGVGVLGMPIIVQGTLCQSLHGVTWYDHPSSSNTNGLDRVSITGIREGEGFKSRIYYANPSDHTSTWIVLSLFDGHNALREQVSYLVGPLENYQRSLAEVFPILTGSTPIDSPWLTVSQSSTVPTPDKPCVYLAGDPPCPVAHPAFLAFVSVTDARSGDSDTHEAQYDVVPTYASSVFPKMPDALGPQTAALANLTIGKLHALVIAQVQADARDARAAMFREAAAANERSAKVKALAAAPLHRRLEKE